MTEQKDRDFRRFDLTRPPYEGNEPIMRPNVGTRLVKVVTRKPITEETPTEREPEAALVGNPPKFDPLKSTAWTMDDLIRSGRIF